MAGFSIDAALKSGFRLARRQWKTVLAWGVGYLLFSVAIQLISVGGALPEYLEAFREDPERAAAAMEQTSAAQAVFTVPLIMVLALLVTALFYGAVCRAMLRPQEGGVFFIRVGSRELWLILTMLGLSVLAILVVLPLVLAVVALVVGLAKVTGTSAVLWGLLIGVPAAVAYIYVAARFSLAWVQAWDEERFVFLDAWRLTRGQGWRIVLMLLALMFLLLIVSIVVLIPVIVVGAILVGVAGLAGDAAVVVVAIVLAVLGLVFFAAFNGVIYTATAAPYVEVYRSLKGDVLPGGETAEVFA